MAIPYFVADSARVTILRPLASSAFGSYSLTLPEGIDLEDVHDFEAPGNELGHVATLTRSRRVGGLARRFVRADVAVSAADPSDPDLIPDSNVDAVLSEAAARVASEFFLESNITKAGLGPWVPFVDFKVGDKARVNIWGHVVTLPITRIEPIISDHDVVDWLVHLGGQLVSDDDAREVENETLRKAFLQDRRELAGIEGQVKAVDKKAEDAKSTADTAKGTAEDAKSTADDALAAATDADGVIQGHVDAAAAASQSAHEASQASLGHSEVAGAHSEAAGVHSADASAASVAASGHSVTAAGHADVAAGHSTDASLASQAAAGHSVTASGHSADASLASQEARDASTTAAGYSGSAWDYSQLADQAALAAGVSEVDAAEWKRLAEVARSLAEAERDAAEAARADAEAARDAAEVSRSAAESGRADAEAARDRAEQARARSMASMAAAEMMRAQAEEARRLAEDARALAEASRADAEDERKDAEAARDLAEGHRDNAFTYMVGAQAAALANIDVALKLQENAVRWSSTLAVRTFSTPNLSSSWTAEHAPWISIYRTPGVGVSIGTSGALGRSWLGTLTIHYVNVYGQSVIHQYDRTVADSSGWDLTNAEASGEIRDVTVTVSPWKWGDPRQFVFPYTRGVNSFDPVATYDDIPYGPTRRSDGSYTFGFAVRADRRVSISPDEGVTWYTIPVGSEITAGDRVRPFSGPDERPREVVTFTES